MSGDHWKMKTSSGLVRAQQMELKRFLLFTDTNTWLCGAVSVGRCRWRRNTAGKPDLPGQRLYLYPSQEYPIAILVGAEELHSAASGVWRMLTGSLAARLKPQVEPQLAPSAAGRSSSRSLHLIQQIQNCVARQLALPALLEECTRLIADYHPASRVEMRVNTGTELLTTSLGVCPGETILIVADLARNQAVYGVMHVSLPAARRVSSNDYLVMDIVAAILSAELAIALVKSS